MGLVSEVGGGLNACDGPSGVFKVRNPLAGPVGTDSGEFTIYFTFDLFGFGGSFGDVPHRFLIVGDTGSGSVDVRLTLWERVYHRKARDSTLPFPVNPVVLIDQRFQVADIAG